MELEAYGHSKISIHALREEGDYKSVPNLSQAWIFLSTPSARRATPARARLQLPAQISIHALREEGDTHAATGRGKPSDFYPRPPRGGRPLCTF